MKWSRRWRRRVSHSIDHIRQSEFVRWEHWTNIWPRISYAYTMRHIQLHRRANMSYESSSPARFVFIFALSLSLFPSFSLSPKREIFPVRRIRCPSLSVSFSLYHSSYELNNFFFLLLLHQFFFFLLCNFFFKFFFILSAIIFSRKM